MEESQKTDIMNRKIRKPLMERKRRARINHSLDELYHLLMDKDVTARGAKLEKADILEMTVRFLKTVGNKDCSKEIRENFENVMFERYLLGFEKCIEETETLVNEIPGLESTIRNNITNHLKICLDKVRKQSQICNKPSTSTPLLTQKKNENGQNRVEGFQIYRDSNKTPSVWLQGCKKFKIVPSKIPNDDVILLIPSDLVKYDGNVTKKHMWRPWW